MRVALACAFAVALASWGALLDRMQPISQPLLFAALQTASLCGVLLGGLWLAQRFESRAARLALAAVLLLGWRLAYFPIMVFSGHLASIGEWLALWAGAPVLVFPSFLLCVAALHTVAALGAGLLLRPPHVLVPVVVVPAFAVATAVSFSNSEDLALLPDRAWRLEARVPPLREARANPYLPRLGASDYRAHQHVMLLAAGLTYETIPESPWARSVKAVLEGAFEANPVASTQDRVVEHYLAYHSAHRLIGCRDLADCPVGSRRDRLTPAVKSLLVLGASGVMGRRVVRLVRRQLPGIVVLAGSRRGRAVAGVPARVVDLRDADALPPILSDVDLVVNAVGPYDYDPTPLVEACVAEGTHYADLAETPDFLAAVASASHGAEERGVCIVPGCSTLPGLVQLLAGPWGERGDVVRVDAWLSLGSRNEVAVGLLVGLLRPLGREAPGGSRWFDRTRARTESDGRVRRYGAYPAAFPEGGLRLGARRVPLAFHVGFDRAWLTRALSLAAPVLARLSDDALRRLARAALPAARLVRGFGTPRGSLVLESRAENGHVLDRVELVADRNGLDIPAAPPVWLAARLAAGARPPPGCRPLDEVVALADAVAWLRGEGHRVEGLP